MAPGDRIEAMAIYRDALARHLGARFNPDDWQAMLDLSILGGLIRFGWYTASEISAAANRPAPTSPGGRSGRIEAISRQQSASAYSQRRKGHPFQHPLTG